MSKACLYQILCKSIQSNLSYRAYKGVNTSYLWPLLYGKTYWKIWKIYTAPYIWLVIQCFRAGVHQIWHQSFLLNASYRTYKGQNRPIVWPLLYGKNPKNSEKICTTPLIQIPSLLRSRAFVYQILCKSIHSNLSYCAYKRLLSLSVFSEGKEAQGSILRLLTGTCFGICINFNLITILVRSLKNI